MYCEVGKWCYVSPKVAKYFHKTGMIDSIKNGKILCTWYKPIGTGIYQCEKIYSSGGYVKYKMVGEYDSAYYDEIKFVANTKEEVEKWLKENKNENIHI